MGRKKIPVRENTEIWKFYKNTGNLVCSSCKFPDSKGKIYFIIWSEISIFFWSWISLLSQFCVCNSRKWRKLAQGTFAVGQGINRENTGNLKMRFEWVPWYGVKLENVLMLPPCVELSLSQFKSLSVNRVYPRGQVTRTADDHGRPLHRRGCEYRMKFLSNQRARLIFEERKKSRSNWRTY